MQHEAARGQTHGEVGVGFVSNQVSQPPESTSATAAGDFSPVKQSTHQLQLKSALRGLAIGIRHVIASLCKGVNRYNLASNRDYMWHLSTC